LNLLPRLNSCAVRLLDNDRAVNQICGLERRAGRGRDQIDHGPGSHDDSANSVAGAVAIAREHAYGVTGNFVIPPQAIGQTGVFTGLTLQTTAADVEIVSLAIGDEIVGYRG
jgi:hypothetical protein